MSRESYPNLIDNLAIVKGETYRKLIESGGITFPGNLTTATLRGQIRSNYVEKSGVLLGTFSFEESTYNADDDLTTIYPYLTEFATVNLPATLKYVEGREPNIKTNPVYDIELFIDDEIVKKKPGFLEIIGEVTGGEVSYNPAEEWTAGIASIELIATVGFTKTYQIWGDEAKTVSLGTFDVIDTQPTEGVSGFGNGIATEETLSVIGSIAENFTFTENGLRVELEGFTGGETVDITTLAKDDTLTAIQNLIPEFTLVDGRLLVNAAITLPSTYQIEGTVELGGTSLTALENISYPVTGTFWQETQPVSLSSLPSVTLVAESGFITYRNTSLSNTPQSIKGSAGSIFGWNFINVNTTPVYIKFFNIAAGSVTVGSSAVTLTIFVPPGDGVRPGVYTFAPNVVPFEVFSTAISIACVTGLADLNNTAPTTPIHVNVRYK